MEVRQNEIAKKAAEVLKEKEEKERLRSILDKKRNEIRRQKLEEREYINEMKARKFDEEMRKR